MSFFGKNPTPPKVTLGISNGGTYAVSGFKELDRWLTLNDAHAASVNAVCGQCGVSGEHRMQLMLSMMTARVYELHGRLLEMMQRSSSISFVLQPGQPLRRAPVTIDPDELSRLRAAAEYAAMARPLLDELGYKFPLERF